MLAVAKAAFRKKPASNCAFPQESIPERVCVHPAMAMLVAWSFGEVANSWNRLRRFALVPAGLLAAELERRGWAVTAPA